MAKKTSIGGCIVELDGNEFINYIKECGAEIKELQDKVVCLEHENGSLKEEIAELEGKICVKDTHIDNIKDLCNKWYWEYDALNAKYNDAIARNEIYAAAMSAVLPKIKEKIDEDLDMDILSELKELLHVRRW